MENYKKKWEELCREWEELLKIGFGVDGGARVVTIRHLQIFRAALGTLKAINFVNKSTGFWFKKVKNLKN